MGFNLKYLVTGIIHGAIILMWKSCIVVWNVSLKKSWVNLRKYFQIGTILKKVYAIASFPILVVVFQLEFVSIAWVINHMTYYNFQCSPLWKIYLKDPSQDLLSSLL